MKKAKREYKKVKKEDDKLKREEKREKRRQHAEEKSAQKTSQSYHLLPRASPSLSDLPSVSLSSSEDDVNAYASNYCLR